MCGQLLRPAQETGIVKAESMASHRQAPIQYSPELNMSNGNSLYGSDGSNFSRLTEHLVFAFLGGYVSMNDLPCLGDLVNGIEGFHRTTPSSMSFYQEYSQVKSLDLNGNFHQLSAISMDLDFNSRIMENIRKSVKSKKCNQKSSENISMVLDTLDASSTACSSPEHTSQRPDKIEFHPENSINAHLICNNFVIDILTLEYPTTSGPFQQCDFTGKFVLSTTVSGIPADSWDSKSVPNTLFKNSAFKLQEIGENQKAEIQKYVLRKHALTSGNLESQFHRLHKNLNDVPASNPPSTTARNNEPISDVNTFKIPNLGTLIEYLYGDLEIPQFLDTESSGMQSEDSCCIIGNNGEGPTYSVPDPSKLKEFSYGDLESPVFLSSESIKEDVPIYAENHGNDSETEVILQSASEESYQCSAMHSSAISETIAELMTESLCDSNGFTNEMDFERDRISSSSQFEKERFEISDSKLPYHRDIFIVADPSNKYKSEAHTALATEPEDPLPKNPTNFVPTISSLLCKSEDDEKNTKTDAPPCTFNTDEPSLMKKNSASNSCENPEIYASSPCCNQKVYNSSNSSLDDPCLLGYYDSDNDAEVADLSDCMYSWLFDDGFNYNTLNMPIRSITGSLTGAFEEKEITPTSSVSVECNGEKIGSDSSFFNSSHHDDLLEMYGLSNQEQYTDIGYKCESPTWPEKMITVSKGQIQKSQACLTSNLTKDDNANGKLIADFSLFHSNTDETSAMNKKWTDKIYEENPENSVSQCYLNQMDCAFETSRIDAGLMDCLPLLHLCNDGFGGSIKHHSLKNDENKWKFAFPEPSTLKDFFFGTLDSPKFLASEFLDEKLDTLDYSLLFGGCEQNDRTEEADLSDRMVLDQSCNVSGEDDNSINESSILNTRSFGLLDLISSPFDISNQDELLEWYRVNDQDQLIYGNWACESPTWPGKI